MSVQLLQPDQVSYIALEGGGGAGNAFPGAIRALEDPRINLLRYESFKQTRIKGFSGASAGAITSLFMACGYDSEEVDAIMAITDFDDFFDRPRIGKVPRIGGCQQVQRFRSGGEDGADLMRIARILIRIMDLLILRRPPRLSDLRDLRDAVESLFSGPSRAPAWIPLLLAVLMLALKSQVPSRVSQQISANSSAVVESVRFDFGIFPGCEIRSFFEQWLQIAAWRVSNPAQYESLIERRGKADALRQMHNWYRHVATRTQLGLDAFANMSFADHQEVFGVQLAVTGTNLATYKSHLFSAGTTPRFPVADAVRISMSLPFAFKPLIIDDDDLAQVMNPGESALDYSPVSGRQEPHHLKGVWVDGGLLNNIPLHAFDNEPGDNPKTLGLRLNFEEFAEIENLVGFFSAYPLGILTGTGEAHISRTRGNYVQSIFLDPMGIGLFDFSPNRDALRRVHNDAEQRVLRYFGHGR